jgi:hypothetical protein
MWREYPDSGKHRTVTAKGEPILLTRRAEPAECWDGESWLAESSQSLELEWSSPLPR